MTASQLFRSYAEAVNCTVVDESVKPSGRRFFNGNRSRVVRLHEVLFRGIAPEIIVYDSSRGFVKVSYKDFMGSKK